MDKKYYWLASFLEKHPDGAVRAYKTTLHCKTLAEAAETISAELYVRARAYGTECLLYNIGIADDDVADLVGKTEADRLGIDWPE